MIEPINLPTTHHNPKETHHPPSFHKVVDVLAQDPEQLEQVYQETLQTGDTAAFTQAINDHYLATPQNLLYAAWYYRLQHAAEQAKTLVIAWSWVIPLALLNGLLFWWLSDDDQFVVQTAGMRPTDARYLFPLLFLLAAPLAATLIITYFAAVGRKSWRRGAIISLILIAAGAYAYFTSPQLGSRPFQEQYLNLMLFHLPLLAWAGIGLFLMADNHDPTNRFAFLIKSLEVFILCGLFAFALGLFTAISAGLFEALDTPFPNLVQRLFWAGGGGLIPVVAAAVIYNPTSPPAEQSFEEGLSKLIALLMRLLLPLTLLVLLVYLAFIPFNFFEPFNNRDVLIIYNGMLFAVTALLVGATPTLRAKESFPGADRWLRVGLATLAALALVVSIYALSAILYRTALDRLTPNRLAFIGWNIINVFLLCLVLFFQMRIKAGAWLDGLYRAYGIGTAVYTGWAIIMIVALPWLFGIDQGDVEALPAAVQEIIYEQPDPILLQCYGTPHIYLLEDGQKRWVKDIDTFENRGYVWGDVERISCANLDLVPAGLPIPADAGSPP